MPDPPTHPAIYPLNPDTTVEDVRARFLAGEDDLGEDAAVVYEIVRQRAEATELGPALFLKKTISWKIPEEVLPEFRYRVTASEALMTEPGWADALPFDEQDRMYISMPSHIEAPERAIMATVLQCEPVVASPGVLDPAEMVERLERESVGRPGSYAKIVSSLVDSGYVALDPQEGLVPTDKGSNLLRQLDDAGFSWLNAEWCKTMNEVVNSVAKGEISATDAVASLLAPLTDSPVGQNTCWIDTLE